MSTTESPTQVPRYGNLRRPRKPGLFGFGAASTAIAFVGVLIGIFAMMIGGPKAAGVVVALTLIAIIPSRTAERDGRSTYARLWKKSANKMNTRLGTNVLISGPTGFTPDGKCRLPGLLAQSHLQTAYDAYDQPYALLYVPSTKHYTVAFECDATGQDPIDQPDIDRQVAHFGQFLAGLGEYPEIDGAQVVIETAPDSGVLLRNAVYERRAENPPPLAESVMREIVETGAKGAPQISSRVTVTFSAAPQYGQRKPLTVEEMHTHIGNLLPSLIGALRVTGAGQSVRVMQPSDLADAVRVAFDPSVAVEVEEARRRGGTGIPWEDAGPIRQRVYDNCLHHDRAWSSSYQMLEPPAGSFYSDQLTRLLAPHPHITRKRVAFLYRPYDATSAAAAVDADVKGTKFTASQKKNPTARAKKDVQAAIQTEEEEARGAGLTRFGIVITATVDDPDQLPRAEAAIRQLAATARFRRIRPALGNQEVAFTASLPCGLVLPKHMRIPPEVKEYA